MKFRLQKATAIKKANNPVNTVNLGYNTFRFVGFLSKK